MAPRKINTKVGNNNTSAIANYAMAAAHLVECAQRSCTDEMIEGYMANTLKSMGAEGWEAGYNKSHANTNACIQKQCMRSLRATLKSLIMALQVKLDIRNSVGAVSKGIENMIAEIEGFIKLKKMNFDAMNSMLVILYTSSPLSMLH